MHRLGHHFVQQELHLFGDEHRIFGDVRLHEVLLQVRRGDVASDDA